MFKKVWCLKTQALANAFIHKLQINKGMGKKFHVQEHYYHSQPGTKHDNRLFGPKTVAH